MSDAKPAASTSLAEHLARKGPDELDKLQVTIDLARQLLASGEDQPSVESQDPSKLPPYPWETTEVHRSAPRQIYLATVSVLTTGLGHTVYFAAGLAHDEDEFRRQLAAHLGHTLAHGATVNAGLGDFQYSRTFISPQLRETLQNYHEGHNVPGGFLYLSQWYENRS